MNMSHALISHACISFVPNNQGCGKTTLVQRLANLTGRSLLVQNLSLQTDSTDLLGGYKPLEMRHVARGVYDKFVDLFVSSFSRSQNAQFLKYVLNAFEKSDWKKLAQCFMKAASMGENKVREEKFIILIMLSFMIIHLTHRVVCNHFTFQIDERIN